MSTGRNFIHMRETQRLGVAVLTEDHMNAFKQKLLKGMRSQERKMVIQRVQQSDVLNFCRFWWSERFLFYKNGSCRYVAGQDETTEIPMIREDIIKYMSNR